MTKRRFIAVGSLALAAFAWQVRATGAEPQTTGKGNKEMTNTVIATFPKAPAALSGQALMVRTLVDNRGAGPVDAPKVDDSSPFAYILRSQKEAGPVYTLSELMTRKRRAPDRVRFPEPGLEALPAGRKVERQEDIADFWNEGFDPGKYWLTVRYQAANMESARAEVTILPLDVESFSSFSNDEQLTSALAHKRQDGQVTLLQRESEMRDPREGVFHVRMVLPKGGRISVATAIDVVPAGSGRWFGWLQDGKLGATHGWGDDTTATAKPVAAAGELLSPGFQVAAGTALFGTVSATGHLHTFIVTGAGLKPLWSAELGSSPVTTGKVQWNCQADRSVTVVWEEPGGRVVGRSFDADGKPLEDAPRVIVPGRPLAWGLPAAGEPRVWALAGDPTGYLLFRISPAGKRMMTRLPGLSGAVLGWDVLEAAQGRPGRIAAMTADKIHSSKLDNPAWAANPAVVRQGRDMHIVSLNGRTMWAEWIEPGFGIRRAKLP